MEIPYRLDTPKAITEAMRINLLGIGEGYRTMLEAAKRFALEKPPALAKAKPVAARDFILPAEDIVRIHGLYGKLFLGKELGEMRKLYVPRTMMISPTSKRVVLSSAEKHETLEFYPTKDYLDLFRGRISKDCVDVSLREKQLRKIRVKFSHTTFDYFESLDKQSFYVLHRKNESHRGN